MSGQDSTSRHSGPAHPPELPRVYLDTRMPAAPAPGGRIIVVGPPARRSAFDDLPALAIVAVALLVLAAAMRWRGALGAILGGRRR